MGSFYTEASSFIKGQADGQKYAKSYLNNITKYLDNLDGVNVSIQGNTANIGYRIMQNQSQDDPRQQIKFMDMKPYFARSSKAKKKKDGGWYLTIPIGNGTTNLRSAYSRKVWDQISHMEYGQTSDGNANVKDIQKALGVSQWGVNQGLKYQWKSANVTRVPWGTSGKRAHYISFRTVSDKSPANSWIVGRRNFTTRVVPNKYADQIADIIKKHVDTI